MENGKQWVQNLAAYNFTKYGPLLGISDEGSAAKVIASVAQGSAKMMALNISDTNAVGVIIDGERMTSAGECPIGPLEYKQLVAKAKDFTNCTTNVGVRINTKYYQQHPEIPISLFINDKLAFQTSVIKMFAPFVETQRPLKLKVLISPDTSHDHINQLKNEFSVWRKEGKLLNKDLHRVALLLPIDGVVTAEKHGELIKKFIDVAANTDINELGLDGHMTEYGRKRINTAGLLNILEVELLQQLLTYANSKKIKLRYRYSIDLESASRTIWTGLNTARSFGLNAAKYGLLPLMLEEQLEVIKNIQEWMSDWTAIPAFYVDTPLYKEDKLYEERDIKEGLKKWIDEVSKLNVKTVLVDAPDRISKRRLMKRNVTDAEGVMTMDEVQEVFNYAKKTGVNILWSGGITYSQAFALGRLNVFGIFTTSTTAKRIPVGALLSNDPQLSHEVEPSEKGIKIVLGLLHGGFLLNSSKLTESVKGKLESESSSLIEKVSTGLDNVSFDQVEEYNTLIQQCWKTELN